MHKDRLGNPTTATNSTFHPSDGMIVSAEDACIQLKFPGQAILSTKVELSKEYCLLYSYTVITGPIVPVFPVTEARRAIVHSFS